MYEVIIKTNTYKIIKALKIHNVLFFLKLYFNKEHNYMLMEIITSN